MVDPFEQLSPETLSPRVEIPEKCRKCAVQCALSDTLKADTTIKQYWTDIAASTMGEHGQIIADLLSKVTGRDPETVGASFKGDIAQTIDAIDRSIMESSERMDSYSSLCDGTLEMTATKGDYTYTTYVCTSAKLPHYTEDSEHAHPMVHLDITPKQD